MTLIYIFLLLLLVWFINNPVVLQEDFINRRAGMYCPYCGRRCSVLIEENFCNKRCKYCNYISPIDMDDYIRRM